MGRFVFLAVLSIVLAGCSLTGGEPNASPPDTSEATVRGVFINGVPYVSRDDGTNTLLETAALIADVVAPGVNPTALVGIRKTLTDEEFNSLSFSQQAVYANAVETAALTDTKQSEVETAYEYLVWLSDLASLEFTVETLEEDPDLRAFLLSGLTSAELKALPADVREALR